MEAAHAISMVVCEVTDRNFGFGLQLFFKRYSVGIWSPAPDDAADSLPNSLLATL